MKLNTLLFMLTFLACAGFTVNGQDVKFPSLDKSPLDAAHYPSRSAFANYLDADDPDRNQKIKVVYSRPNKNDRVVFGELLKYGELWRLGANEGTEVMFFVPVEIGGKTIQSGTYTMNAELHEDHWVLNISTERFIAGTSNLDASKIIASAKIPTSQIDDVREAFTIGFQKVDEGNVNMIFEWDRTRAVLPINLNAPTMAGDDKSPMDLAAYPASSRFRNLAKPEDFDNSAPKVRVVYSRPQMNGRKVFGELLKYGEMWRVGANQTTEVTFFTDVMIGDTKINSGRYGLFAKVHEDNWEFIIHKNVQSWGPPNHNDEDNIVTVKAPIAKTPSTLEALSITYEEVGDNMVNLVVGWEDTMARLPIKMME